MTDLSQIYEAIGGLKASVDNLATEQGRARDRDEKLFDRLGELTNAQKVSALQLLSLVEKHGTIDRRLAGVEDGVADYRSVKRTGMALWVGSVGVAGVIGWLVQFIGDWWHGKA